MAEDSMDKIGSAEFDSTIGALRGGVTNIAFRRAAAEVEHWHGRLRDTNDPLLSPIAENLGALEGQLTSENPDGAVIAALLEKLSRQVGEAASGDYPPAISDKLQQLSGLLGSAAMTLASQ